MLEAGLWGALGASSLLIGALVGLLVPLSQRVIGLVLGFGAGTLISAVAFELTEEAYALGGAGAVSIGLAVGALTYFAGDWLVEARGARRRMDPMGATSAAGSALLLGALLDGIPESAVVGLSLLDGGSVEVAVLAAVFLSNMPESLASSRSMRAGGSGAGHIVLVWTGVVLVCGAAAAVGFAVLREASGISVALVQAFAGGAVLTMIADTMLPEATAHGGRAVGLTTVLGFALAWLLTIM